ncbi:MAG: hypothetical protein ACI9MR_001606 [Myxococcota bacterium]|jgi:hypothetical protein
MMRGQDWIIAGAILVAGSTGCGDDTNGGADSTTTDTSQADTLAADTVETGTTPDLSVGNCLYTNTFAGAEECREYGGSWTAATAATDCETVFFNMPGVFSAGSCTVAEEIGRCTVGDLTADGYVTVSTGDPSTCGAARTGCETFAGGTFDADAACNNCAASDQVEGAPFVPPYVDCRPALAGEPAGATDGSVCTTTMISASTEPGRRFADYADCDVVRRQRPYYAAPPTVTTDENDPRLGDADYMAEVAWLKTEASASACTCCHAASDTPEGAAEWDIEADPIWTDTLSDEALAMIVGYTESASFGYYPADQNNGFDRSKTGLPTTDVARLQAFGAREFERRGLTPEAAADLDPFAPFFRELIEYRPEACAVGLGVDADGGLRWDGGGARYLSILAADSASPGVPPNWDLPDGTLWAIAAAPTSPAFSCGLSYGELPEDVTQRFPAEGAAPALVTGETYYLHVQADVTQPITRCLFTAP